MIVILCHPGDSAAVWLHGVLRTLGLDTVDLVTVEQVVYSRQIIHRLGAHGDTGAIHLADGRVLRPETITGLINRVQYLPTAHFAAADAAERAYATEELSAFMLAWLDSVAGRVINPPTPFALGGGAFQTATTIYLAAMAGLPTVAWRASTTESADDDTLPPPATHCAIAFDGRLFGTLLPRQLQEGCQRLAALLGVPLLQILLHHSPERGWQFVGANGAADFRLGGKPFAAAMAQALTGAEPDE